MISDNFKEKYMLRCLELARKAKGKTGLNPMVGCVIVHDNRIIGEGYHEKYGEAHAEVNAINSVKNKELLKESVLFVSLEPCSHYGKTPPCSLLILEKKIPRVVVAVEDPNPLVSGKGINILKQGGVKVECGTLKEEATFLNRRFFTNIIKKRPYIILKWAESSDGFIDKKRSKNALVGPNWISNPTARKLVHKWRSTETGIMVGVNTVLKDDPGLNVRDWSGNDPVRIIIDRNNRISANLKVKSKEGKCLLFTEKEEVKGGNCIVIKIGKEVGLSDILNTVLDNQIGSILVEGGSKLIKSFIDMNLWDEARVFKSSIKFSEGVKAPEIIQEASENLMFRNNQLKIYTRISIF